MKLTTLHVTRWQSSEAAAHWSLSGSPTLTSHRRVRASSVCWNNRRRSGGTPAFNQPTGSQPQQIISVEVMTQVHLVTLIISSSFLPFLSSNFLNSSFCLSFRFLPFPSPLTVAIKWRRCASHFLFPECPTWTKLSGSSFPVWKLIKYKYKNSSASLDVMCLVEK